MTFHEKYQLLCASKQFPFVIDIEPRPAPRPRGSNFHNPAWYKIYKENIVDAIKSKGGIPKGNYFAIDLSFHIRYPKRILKKDPQDGAIYRAKGDADNYTKGVLDALQDGEYIPNDRMITSPWPNIYRCVGDPYISFVLFSLPESLEPKFEPYVKLLREDYESTYSLQFPSGRHNDGDSDPLGLFTL